MNDPDPLDDVPQRLFGERDRQQIVRVAACDPSPTEMVTDPPCPDIVRERLEFPQVIKVERVAADSRRGDERLPGNGLPIDRVDARDT